MRLEDRVGLLVPTYNRPFFIRKLLRYYSRLDSAPSIVIADSSPPQVFEKNAESIGLFPGLRVIHSATPGERVMLAMQQSLAHLRGPYAIFTGDDDFLEPHALAKFADFLDRNPDYQTAISGIVRPQLDEQGEGLAVGRVLPGSSGLASLDDPSAARRLVRVFSPTLVNTFALHRTAGFREIIRRSAASGFETDLVTYVLAEILHIGLTVLYGKQKFFSGVYLAMCLYMPHRTHSHPECGRLRDRIIDPRWGQGVGQLLDQWAEVLCEKDKVERNTADSLAMEGFFTWMKDHLEIRSQKWVNARPDLPARLQALAKLTPMLTAANIEQKAGRRAGRESRALVDVVREVIAFPEEGLSPRPPAGDVSRYETTLEKSRL